MSSHNCFINEKLKLVDFFSAWVKFGLVFYAKCTELNTVQFILHFCHVTKFEVHTKQRIHLFSSAISSFLLLKCIFKIVLSRQHFFARHDLLLSMCSRNHGPTIMQTDSQMVNVEMSFFYIDCVIFEAVKS